MLARNVFVQYNNYLATNKVVKIMQANATQRAHIVTNLQQQMQGKIELIAHANDDGDDEDGDMAADYANTVAVLLECYTAFITGNCLQTLCSSIRSGLDTMVYEDVFDMLACSAITTELIYSLT
jgi:hypothetical protein